MNARIVRLGFTVPCLALLLALGGCGGRVDNADTSTAAAQDHPSVEINRRGEPGAQPDTVHVPVAGDKVITHVAGYDVSTDRDAQIAAKVHDALVTDPDLAAMKIDVSSDDGAVTLRGRAPDPAARDRATEIARNVQDVKSVENQLTLG